MTGRRGPTADLADMFEALGRDRVLFGELIELFLTSAPPLLEELRDAVASGEAQRIRRGAHNLRGCVAQFSDGDAGDTLARLERHAIAADRREATAELRRMEQALTTLIRAMRPYRTPRRRVRLIGE